MEGLRYVVDAGGAETLFDLERDPQWPIEDVAGDSAYADSTASGPQAAAREAARARAAAATAVDVLSLVLLRDSA